MMRGLRSCVYTVIFFFYFLQANKLSVAANFSTKRNSDAHLNSKYRTMPQHSVIKFNDTAILFVTLPACRRANALNLPLRCVVMLNCRSLYSDTDWAHGLTNMQHVAATVDWVNPNSLASIIILSCM